MVNNKKVKVRFVRPVFLPNKGNFTKGDEAELTLKQAKTLGKLVIKFIEEEKKNKENKENKENDEQTKGKVNTGNANKAILGKVKTK